MAAGRDAHLGREAADQRAREHAGTEHDDQAAHREPRAATADEAGHAGTANRPPEGNEPTWMSSANAARVAAEASTSAGAPRAARRPPEISHMVPPWRSARSRS